MKGVERTKGVWDGSGNSGRKARPAIKKQVRKAGKRKVVIIDQQLLNHLITSI